MTVKQLITKLLEFDSSLEVCITDGYECVSYQGDFLIVRFDDTVDIGVGGMNINA